MSELREFTKMVILRDTPETRQALGNPLEGNYYNNTVTAPGMDNPFYKKLVDGSTRGFGWRSGYPNIDNVLAAGNLSDGSSATNSWGKLIRPNILNSIGADISEAVGFDKEPQASGTAIIFEDKLYIGGATVGWEYDEPTTFQDNSPSPGLAVGDYIFWGEDPNNLNIGGKIKTIYTSGADYDAGARYQFEKNINVPFPEHDGGTYDELPIPQNIYYFRNTWVNKGIKNDYNNGFYLLIGMEQSSQGSWNIYPYINCAGRPRTDDTLNSSTYSITDVKATNKTAYTDLIRIKRISNKFKNDETATDPQEEIIPCSIHRTNGFYYAAGGANSNVDSTGIVQGLFGNSATFQDNITPQWCAYYLNPYGDSSFKLDKSSTYIVEVNERLPAAIFGSPQQMFVNAINGSI